MKKKTLANRLSDWFDAHPVLVVSILVGTMAAMFIFFGVSDCMSGRRKCLDACEKTCPR